jgi:hypothetical protein
MIENMIGFAFCVVCLLQLALGDSNYCESWSYTDVLFIKATSLASSAVLDRVASRSFLQCAAKCGAYRVRVDECGAVQGCSGVAFRDGECSFLDGTAAQGFVTPDGSGDDYKVMVYKTDADGQVRLYFYLYLNIFLHKSQSTHHTKAQSHIRA